MRRLLSFGFAATFGFLSALPVEAQNARIINVVPDGSEIVIPLTAADMGRDIILLAESTKKAEIRVQASLAGAPGVVGRVWSTTVAKNAAVAALNLYSGWNIVKVRYPQGDFKTEILVGESTTSPGSGSCFSQLDAFTAQLMRALYPDLTDAEICQILNGGYQPPPEPSVEATPARGVILRDACSSKQKLVVQFRISTLGQPASLFDGTKVLRASLKIWADKGKSRYVRIKPPEGRDRTSTSAIYLSPAIVLSWQDKYGAPGTDKLVVQTYKKGKANMTKTLPTRPLFGSVQYSLAKVGKYLDKRKKLSITLQNRDEAYNVCIPPGSKNRCTRAYSARHGIRCGGL